MNPGSLLFLIPTPIFTLRNENESGNTEAIKEAQKERRVVREDT